MSKQTLEIISIHKIELSTTNPRKVFDPKALEELSESIKEHGILQPILVRPYVDEKSSWQDYQLVCGERRYRAAILAGLEEVPVSIRVLTDDEAFELQIIENLERKDVHPLDEADAFKKMLDSKKYTIADISAKMAKPESFIVQRLKLVDLIESVREDFLRGHLGIGHAILISRCDEFKQKDIFDNAQPYKEGIPDYGTVKELKESIEDDSYLLTQAKFSLSDTKLNDTCACDVCPKRSGANPVLFADMQDDRCFDINCFDAKNQAFIEQEVARIINEGIAVHIISGYGKISELVETMCKQFGVPILQQYHDYTLDERDGTIQSKGFYVSGHKSGETVDIWKYVIENKDVVSIDDNTSNNSPMSMEEIEAKESIKKIEARAARANELDGEKVWNEIRQIDTSEIKTIIGGLFEVEVNAVCLAMISKLGYYGNQEVKKLVGDFTVETLQERDFTKFEFNQIQRIFFLECLPVAFGNYYSNIYNYAYTQALMHYEGDKIKEIIANQKAIADVRMDKADAKIKELNAKIEKLNPTESTPDNQNNDEFGNKIIALNKEAQGLKEEVTDWISNKNIKESADELSMVSDYPTFEKITRKRFSLNNSYFKNRTPQMPATPLEVMYYFNQHGELPFDMGSDTENWLYECYVEYQKRAGVYGSQFFTPPATAKRMAELADEYFYYEQGVPQVLDACCGFGMLTKPLLEKGFIVNGFDINSGLLELYNEYTGCISKQKDINSYLNEDITWKNIVSNPPYEIKECTQFLKLLMDLLEDDGTSILLLPKSFIDKEKPKALAEVLAQFEVIHREDMQEDFERTKINAEIVVIKKA